MLDVLESKALCLYFEFKIQQDSPRRTAYNVIDLYLFMIYYLFFRNRLYIDASSVATFLFKASMRWIGLRLDLTSAVLALTAAFILVVTKGSINPATAGLILSICVRVCSCRTRFSLLISMSNELYFR